MENARNNSSSPTMNGNMRGTPKRNGFGDLYKYISSNKTAPRVGKGLLKIALATGATWGLAEVGEYYLNNLSPVISNIADMVQ